MARACAIPSIAMSATRALIRELNTFVESYGSQLLDASILLLPAVGFLPAYDPRVRGTLAAIEKHMMRDGFVLRHDPRETSDQKQPIEGAFLACSLWLADAYVLAGEIDKAQALFDRVVAVANDLGLLAEEFDSGAGRQTGNFPQALTHIALINTAHNLSDAKKPVEKPAMQRSRVSSLVVPAKAGTVTQVIVGRGIDHAHQRECTAYGSRRSPGRRWQVPSYRHAFRSPSRSSRSRRQNLRPRSRS